jgi:superfamily II DNA or RNA helicase
LEYRLSLNQFHNLFSSLFNEPIGYIGNGICNIERINIASIWTIGCALSMNKKAIFDDDVSVEEKFDLSQKEKILNLLKQTKVHILDECHVVSCQTVTNIHKNIDPEYIFGFSGTPYKNENSYLLVESVLGDKIVDVTATELINRKVIAQPLIKFIPVPPMAGLSTANYQTVYKTYVVDNVIRNNLILSETKKLLEKKYKPLILFQQVRHGKMLFDMLTEAGIKCALLSGIDSLKIRNQVNKQFTDGEIDVIIASTIYDIGVDVPAVSSLILASTGMSLVKALQRIGRSLRKYPGKTHSAIVEFYDQVKFLKKHSLKRCEIYSQEPGFKIIKCKEMLK